MWNGRNVFVTGATGFLGYWLTDLLVKRGAHVVCLVRDWTPHAPFLARGLSREVTVVRGDIQDREVLERTINEYECRTVLHLAAQAIVGTANRNPIATFEANILGTWNVLEACRRSGSLVEQIVVASSDKAYGDHATLPYREDFALQGRHPYDVSKSCADLICLSYHHTYRLPVCITRCGNLFGPGDLNFSRLIPGTIRSVLQGERPVIRSDGSPKRDYVFVRDIAAAYLLLAESMARPDVVGQAFNFGTGEPQSVLAMTGAILRAAEAGELEPDVRNEAVGEIKHQYLACDLARERLGWRSDASLDTQLRETVAWYRDFLQTEAAPQS